MIVTSYDPAGLACSVAAQLQVPLIRMEIVRFADGELQVSLPNTSLIANKEVTIIQSTGYDVNEMAFVLACMIHELKNAGAQKIRTIIPYMGYSRQDTSVINEKPGNAALIAQLIECAGSDEVILVEVHKQRVLSFFTKSAFSLSLTSCIGHHITQTFNLENICLVAPDQGAHERVVEIAQLLKVPTIIFTKERYAADATRVATFAGNCEGKDAIIIDDIISTGGTALHAAQKTLELGCSAVYGYFVHPVMPNGAIERLTNSPLKKIFVTNTLALPQAAKDLKLAGTIEILDISTDLAQVVRTRI